ncbi:ABC transporter permease [Dongia soli]|uniref:ABC transporter permease n=1 Tax=Dongia soli TaxID=600628 RepID=A0ABU5EH45_9PROT|nr:ABC transporter permease [Dongia soli]MDY0885563.1 ABC transporter permease [Dongia soli]
MTTEQPLASYLPASGNLSVSAMLRGMRRQWLWFYTRLFAVILYLPSVFILLFSFNSGIHVAFPLKEWTFDWYIALGRNGALLTAAGNSLKVGVAASLMSTTIGVLGGFALVRYRWPGGQGLTALSMMPLLMPSIIMGISLLVLLRTIGFGNSLTAITIGHIVFCTPLSLSIMMSRFVTLDRTLEEAALDLGANEIGTFLKITLPLSVSAIAASIILCLTASIDEFVIAFFLAGTDVTLPLYIWGQLRFPSRLPEILALGSCMLLGTLALIVVGEMLRRRGAAQNVT